MEVSSRVNFTNLKNSVNEERIEILVGSQVIQTLGLVLHFGLMLIIANNYYCQKGREVKKTSSL